MGSSLAGLDQRDVARVRAELAAVIAAHFAYPTFFDYHAQVPRMRPLSAARRQEIAQFAQLADFSGVEHFDLTAPQVRRALERILLRYLDLNPDLARPAALQQRALMRVEVPRVAAEIQRGLAAFASGTLAGADGFALARPRVSWHGTDGERDTLRDPLDPAGAERSALLIQAALLPRRDSSVVQVAPPAQAPVLAPPPASELETTAPHPIMTATPVPDVSTFWGGYPAPLDGHGERDRYADGMFVASEEQTAPRPTVSLPPSDAVPDRELERDTAPHIATSGNGHAANVAPAAWAALLRDLTGPVPALPTGRPPAVPSSPFVGLEDGAQSGMFGALPANPFSASAQGSPSVHGATSGNGHHNGRRDPFSDIEGDTDPRKLPPGLVAMYSAYLRAMRPGPAPHNATPTADQTPAPGIPDSEVWARSTMPPAFQASRTAHDTSTPTGPASAPSVSTPGAGTGPGSDQMIFAQLRNQLDAYLRATARTAGVQVAGTDPERVLAALRRNGRMSAADVRLAESILAITGRVLAGGTATQEDYRRAFMLYLLFHRGRIGA